MEFFAHVIFVTFAIFGFIIAACCTWIVFADEMVKREARRLEESTNVIDAHFKTAHTS
jgi:hypothetical protein